MQEKIREQLSQSSFSLSVKIPDYCPIPASVQDDIIKAVSEICDNNLAQYKLTY